MKKWIGSILVSIALVGCSHSDPIGLTVDGSDQRVIMGDFRVSRVVTVEDIDTVYQDGHMRGVVRVKNNARDDYSIQYRFYWYDEQGLEVNLQPGAWQHVLLHSGEDTSLSEVSISPNGKKFRVQIRKYTN